MFPGDIVENGARGQSDQWYRESERGAAKVRRGSPAGAAHQRRRPQPPIASECFNTRSRGSQSTTRFVFDTLRHPTEDIRSPRLCILLAEKSALGDVDAMLNDKSSPTMTS
jgi:hypothetical protein